MGSRNYCFTTFNKPTIDTTDVLYYIYQKEKCPTTKKEHYQGYIELKKVIRMQSLKTNVFRDNTVHLEKRRGSQEQAIEYCQKKESQVEPPVIFGTPTRQGRRTDLELVHTLIKEKKSKKEIVEECFGTYVKYHRGIEKAMEILLPPKKFKPIKVYYIWGEAGTGKTRSCYEYDSELYKAVKVISGHVPWFDGYTGQKTILFDDYNGGYSYEFFLELLDGYPMKLQVKGSVVDKDWDVVLITSNQPIHKLYPTKGLSPALKRRITKIIQVGDKDDYQVILNQLIDDYTPPTPDGTEVFNWDSVTKTKTGNK